MGRSLTLSPRNAIRQHAGKLMQDAIGEVSASQRVGYVRHGTSSERVEPELQKKKRNKKVPFRGQK